MLIESNALSETARIEKRPFPEGEISTFGFMSTFDHVPGFIEVFGNPPYAYILDADGRPKRDEDGELIPRFSQSSAYDRQKAQITYTDRFARFAGLRDAAALLRELPDMLAQSRAVNEPWGLRGLPLLYRNRKRPKGKKERENLDKLPLRPGVRMAFPESRLFTEDPEGGTPFRFQPLKVYLGIGGAGGSIVAVTKFQMDKVDAGEPVYKINNKGQIVSNLLPILQGTNTGRENARLIQILKALMEEQLDESLDDE